MRSRCTAGFAASIAALVAGCIAAPPPTRITEAGRDVLRCLELDEVTTLDVPDQSGVWIIMWSRPGPMIVRVIRGTTGVGVRPGSVNLCVVETDGDVADLYRHMRGHAHPTLRGEPSAEYAAFFESGRPQPIPERMR